MTGMPAAAPQPDQAARRAGMTMGVGALIAFVSVFLTWVTVSLDLSGFPGAGSVPARSESGIGTSDGKLALVLAILIGLLAFVMFSGKARKPRVVGIIALILSALLAVAAFIDVTTTKDDARESFIEGVTQGGGGEFAEQFAEGLDVSIGIGLYLALAGGLIALAGSVMSLTVKPPAASWAAGPPAPPGAMPPPAGSEGTPPMGSQGLPPEQPPYQPPPGGPTSMGGPPPPPAP